MSKPLNQATIRKKPRPLPMPEAGQVWHTTKPRSLDRTVIKVEHWKFRTAIFVEGMGAMSLGEFHAWARRAEAKPYAALSAETQA